MRKKKTKKQERPRAPLSTTELESVAGGHGNWGWVPDRHNGGSIADPGYPYGWFGDAMSPGDYPAGWH